VQQRQERFTVKNSVSKLGPAWAEGSHTSSVINQRPTDDADRRRKTTKRRRSTSVQLNTLRSFASIVVVPALTEPPPGVAPVVFVPVVCWTAPTARQFRETNRRCIGS